VVPGLDERLDAIFRRCYARRESRYASASEALADLDALGVHAPLAPIPPVRRALRAGTLIRAVALAADVLPFAAFGIETESLRFTVPIFIFYDALATAILGGSLGKRLLGLRIVDTEGAPLELSRALGRTLVRLVSLPTVAGPLLALGREKLSLHDQLTVSGTRPNARAPRFASDRRRAAPRPRAREALAPRPAHWHERRVPLTVSRRVRHPDARVARVREKTTLQDRHDSRRGPL
jgi:uncharacterized RDD family membrane protein YckC